jgi:hypothetical protein
LIAAGFLKAMVITGVPLTRIASALSIAPSTLRKFYSKEIDESADQANTQVVANLFRIATGKTPSAAASAMFWCKTKLGWREASKVEVGSEAGTALIVYSGCLKVHDETM